MINPFRNRSLGIPQLLSTVLYPSAMSSSPVSRRRKGFFHKLITLGDIFRSATASGTTVSGTTTIDIDAADLAPGQDQVDSATDALQLLQNGHRLLQQGDLTGAIAHYRQAVQQDGGSGEAYQYLAAALSQAGNLEEAAYCYRQAIALGGGEQPQLEFDASNPLDLAIDPATSSIDCDPASNLQLEEADSEPDIPWFEQASFHLQQAIVNCNAGAWEEAEAVCQMAIETLEPEAFTAYLTLGRSLQGQRQLSAAEQAYQKALVLQPSSAEAHARLASLYTDQQRLPEAAKQYQAAIQFDPQFAGAYWKLAEVWQQLGEEEPAVTCWYQAFRLQPSWATAMDYCRLADRLLKISQLPMAQECYGRALQANPDLVEAHLGMGTVLHQLGEVQAAASCYRRAIQQKPQDETLCLRLGDALALLEQWEDARICYQQLLQLAPNHLAAVLGLQQCLIRLAQWQDALLYSYKRLELQPSAAQAWHELGDVLSRLSQWTEAIDAYQKAIDLDPRFSWSYNNLGDVLLQLEQWQPAVKAYQAAISLHSGFVWSHYNLGEAFSHLQDWDRAITSYRIALQLQPNLPHISGRLADALQHRAAHDYANAFSFYQQAIHQNPHDPENYHKALELQPDSVELYLGLVEALVVQERLDEAIVCCQIARQLSPEDATIITKLKQILQQHELAKRPRVDEQAQYERWIEKYTPTAEQLQQMAKTATDFAYQPLISVLMPVFNPPVPFLKAAIQSVLDQVYPCWELCIADDASTEEIRALLREYAAQDSRIRVVFRKENGHIAAASNSALSLAKGEYIALLDHDDRLAPEALYEVVSLLNQHPEVDMVYSDEDKLDQQNQRVHPFFKPDWCPDSFLSRMYTCHLGIYRRRLVETIGGFREGYEGSQDYDLVLRLTEQTERIFHLPKVLYHWRMHTASTASSPITKTYAEEAAKRAIVDACQRRGETVQAVVTNPEAPGVYIVRYQITEYKLVSIIIPTRNLGRTLDQCLQSVFENSTYPNYEVILLDNGSDEIETLETIDRWQQQEPARLKRYPLDIPFNYSKINNYAVAQAKGEYLLFLNNDIEVVTADWIESMIEQAQRPSIGAVGALLLYPDNTIQHAGVVLGIGGIAGHSHKYYPNDHRGYFSQLVSVNNYSAITAACLMCRREVFEQIGGFDEALAVAFNDVDLCLKMGQLGYRNVFLPHVVLYHHESKTRGTENTLAKQRRFQQELKIMQQRWGNLLQHDSCYSPHLTLEREDYSLRIS